MKQPKQDAVGESFSRSYISGKMSVSVNHERAEFNKTWLTVITELTSVTDPRATKKHLLHNHTEYMHIPRYN